MTNAQKWLLALQMIILLFALFYLSYQLVRARQERLKYKLYAVRDDLISLVASKELGQDSYLFGVFYSAITRSISEIQDLTLWSFIRASMTAKSALQREAAQRLVQEITNASPEVQRIVIEFAATMAYIITANSPFFTAFLGLVELSQRWSKSMTKTVVNLLPGARERYDTYLYFDSFYDHKRPAMA